MKQNEHNEQSALVAWAQLHRGEIPELDLLYAIPNGGARHVTVAKKLKAEGVKSGVPDLCLPVARSGYNSLYIEMKIPGGRVSENQQTWLINLSKQGSLCVVVFDWYQGALFLAKYARGELPHASTSTQKIYEIGGSGRRNKKTLIKKEKPITN